MHYILVGFKYLCVDVPKMAEFRQNK